ncbi:MAG: cysteine desulfurase DndA [Verrucomicrobia bacterium]|nr:cysteine desulfurase DndA [Pseudomonadota bacterium]NBS06115.1 cysteine desulfurase DndA [Verrucomicrobiota bacterium]NBS78901.1 cysteine desulfurase DndA [bacterium]NBS49422.1 cysteine desulfurase DndA [Verrucomicrobiota bacterium]NBT23586.1 cysteine desulfurase DndA [bacterium]
MSLAQPVYMDCNATTPLEPEVGRLIRHFFEEEYGNEGSRTHAFGARAKEAVHKAREQIARLVDAKPEEVIFTSGATESNNLAILGLAHWGRSHGKTHIVSSPIEHKAVLEPIEILAKDGFEVDWVTPEKNGRIDSAKFMQRIRPSTLLVSMMHANNETGVTQPIGEVAEGMMDHPAWFHVDAAQTFGKLVEPLKNKRIDMISASGHKIYGPKGVGVLIVRHRKKQRAPLLPLVYGGGQEQGLRPGTLPVPLIAGLGLAAELGEREHGMREKKCRDFRKKFLKAIQRLNPKIHGEEGQILPHTANVSFPGISAEEAMVRIRDLVAVSNGSACTSAHYQPSHVLKAMGLAKDEIVGALRFSWCHLTPEPDWETMVEKLRG